MSVLTFALPTLDEAFLAVVIISATMQIARVLTNHLDEYAASDDCADIDRRRVEEAESLLQLPLL